ncbi:MAG: hypothetical protein NWF05_03595 [Candidatus Bathyarchaeota archaeon]|nr:hypothetical protein [Candidatus Bathyarchaeota archaeon]
MKATDVQKAKTAVKALSELSDAKKDAASALKSTCIQGEATEKLWNEGNKSRLIQIGVSLVVFPEPTPVSETIGAGFIAAGAIQKGIKSQAIYMEDVGKTLKSTLREIKGSQEDLQIGQ